MFEHLAKEWMRSNIYGELFLALVAASSVLFLTYFAKYVGLAKIDSVVLLVVMPSTFAISLALAHKRKIEIARNDMIALFVAVFFSLILVSFLS